MIARIALAALVALLALPATAGAHAILQGSAPERGAALDAAPREVSLRFDEPVEASFGALRVYDASGETVEEGEVFHPGGDDHRVAVRLPDSLPEGGYTVTYRVISADAHPVSGGFVFAVGEGGAGARSVDELLAGTQSGPVTSTAFGAARAIQFAAIGIAVGALLFLWLCWRGVGPIDTVFDRRVRSIVRAAAVAGALSAAAGIVLQGATGDGTTFWSAVAPGVVGEVLGTRFGTVWGLAVLAWIAVLALPSHRLRAVPLAALCLLPALSGHAGVQKPVWVVLPANVVHVVAISAWVGGIAVLVLALRAATAQLDPPERTRLLAGTLGRFSTVALLAFALILASGVAQSLAAVDDVAQLTGTAYGRSVAIKVGLFAVLVALGAVNSRRLLPRLRRAASDGAPPGAAGSRLRSTLRGEFAVAAVVLGVTGALATYPPAEAVSSGPFATSATLGPARLEVTVDPARVGPNSAHLYMFDRRTGAQWDRAVEVKGTAELPGKGIGRIPLELTKAGPGHYTLTGAALGVAGDWQFVVTARVSEFDAFEARFTVPVE